MKRWCVLALASMTLWGCVSKDAGYRDVESAAAARSGQKVRFDGRGSGKKSDELTRSLLAQALTADAAVQVGLLNSPAVQADFAEIGVARAELVRALAIPNPSVELAVRFGSSSRPDVEINALEDLSGFLLMPLRKGAADAAFDAAKAEVVGRLLDCALAIRLAFYEHQASAQTLELRRSVLQAVRASHDAARRLHEAGNLTDLNLANERALYEEARIEFARAEARERSTHEELSARMGLFGAEASFTLAPRLADAAPLAGLGDELERQALSKSLDLEASRRRYTAAAKRSNYAQARGYVPLLRAGVSAERSDGGSFALGPAAAIGVPLFYQGQADVDAAEAEMQRERKAYEDQALAVRSAARSLSARLHAAAESADYYRRVLLPLRAEIVQQTELEYNAMSVGVFQLLSAKREQIRAAESYVDLLREYWTLRARVEQLRAGRLPALGAEGSLSPRSPADASSADVH